MSGTDTGTTTFDLPSDTEIRIERTVAAPRDLVFAVHTDPRHLPNWMVGPPGWTMDVCEIDLRPGGTFRYVWHNADNAELAITGSYREIDRPGRIVSTERWSDGDWPETVNTLTLTETGGRTTITTLVGYPSKETRDLALQSGMREGMEAGFGSLDAYLAAQPAPLTMRLQLVPVPVADIDRALAFYTDGLGFTVDHDVQPGNGARIVQLTPAGSACSILLSKGLPGMDEQVPGSLRGLHVVVDDIEHTREALLTRGVKPGEVMDMGGILYSELADPDGNGWLLQQLR